MLKSVREVTSDHIMQVAENMRLLDIEECRVSVDLCPQEALENGMRDSEYRFAIVREDNGEAIFIGGVCEARS